MIMGTNTIAATGTRTTTDLPVAYSPLRCSATHRRDGRHIYILHIRTIVLI
jgi:hypothetical protein